MSKLNESMNVNPISEIQLYLKEISKYRSEIIMEQTDGVFGPETKKAVIAFQEIYGLPPTGIVDLATWSKMISEYNRYINMSDTPNKLDCFPGNISEIKLEDEKDIVYIIQVLLNNFSKKYKNFDIIEVTGIYNQETEDAVKKFQTINRLPLTGIVNIKTWNALSNVNNICRFHDE